MTDDVRQGLRLCRVDLGDEAEAELLGLEEPEGREACGDEAEGADHIPRADEAAPAASEPPECRDQIGRGPDLQGKFCFHALGERTRAYTGVRP